MRHQARIGQRSPRARDPVDHERGLTRAGDGDELAGSAEIIGVGAEAVRGRT